MCIEVFHKKRDQVSVASSDAGLISRMQTKRRKRRLVSARLTESFEKLISQGLALVWYLYWAWRNESLGVLFSSGAMHTATNFIKQGFSGSFIFSLPQRLARRRRADFFMNRVIYGKVCALLWRKFYPRRKKDEISRRTIENYVYVREQKQIFDGARALLLELATSRKRCIHQGGVF